jgi:hypothetical protein
MSIPSIRSSQAREHSSRDSSTQAIESSLTNLSPGSEAGSYTLQEGNTTVTDSVEAASSTMPPQDASMLNTKCTCQPLTPSWLKPDLSAWPRRVECLSRSTTQTMECTHQQPSSRLSKMRVRLSDLVEMEQNGRTDQLRTVSRFLSTRPELR